MTGITPTSIYECQEIIDAIERQAEQNEGELTDEQMAALVEANAKNLAQMGKLAGAIAYLDFYVDTGQKEIDRINKLLTTAKTRRDSIKRFLTPFVAEQRAKLGRPVDAGKFKLSVRNSKAVIITDPECFARGGYPDESRKKVIWEPDKKALKERLESGKSHPGAELEERQSLIIK